MNDCLIFFYLILDTSFLKILSIGLRNMNEYKNLLNSFSYMFLVKKKLFIANKRETIAIYSETYANN